MNETINGDMEPFAEALIRAYPKQPLQQFAIVSIAVSLKRIADSLGSDGARGLLKDVHHDITNLAFEAGRSFQHGANQHR